jgi:23S rRNA (guanosine2251-2'-O)-methyltransferase
VVVPKDRAVGMNATVRKVAAGAAETMPLATVTNLSRALKLLKDAGQWIVGADMSGNEYAWQADLTGSRAIVMGGEGEGLRELTRKSCDYLVRLPRLGAMESLNVSVACGMLLYEAVRQRDAG